MHRSHTAVVHNRCCSVLHAQLPPLCEYLQDVYLLRHMRQSGHCSSWQDLAADMTAVVITAVVLLRLQRCRLMAHIPARLHIRLTPAMSTYHYIMVQTRMALNICLLDCCWFVEGRQLVPWLDMSPASIPAHLTSEVFIP